VLADIEREIFDDPGDHAGELETSIIMAYYPHLVAHRPDGGLNADDGATASTRFEAVNRGWVSITRPWHLLTTNSGAGNPHPASAEKGRRAMEQIVERLAGFLVELSAAPLDERFPY
jgi:creatinine amidohydrolase